VADWRIRKRYGRGAARIVLCPVPYREPAHELTLLEGCRSVGPELLSGAKSAVVFGAMLVAIILFTAMRDRVDFSQTQLMVWGDPIPAPIVEPPPVVEPPPPVPVPVVAKTPPKPKPVPVPVAKPKPPPVQIAKAEKPKPKPKPKARKPKIEMAALSKPVDLETAPLKRERVAALRPEQRKALALASPGFNAPNTPELAPTRPSRTQRVSKLDSGKNRVVPALAVASSRAVYSEMSARPAARRTVNAFASVRSSGKPRVDLAAPRAAAIAAIPADTPRSRRSSAVVASASRGRRSTKDFAVAPAALAPARPRPIPVAPVAPRRTTRAEAASAASRGSGGNLALRGVALGSLASCRSDREEDLLKQRVLAAVRNRETCTSSAGSYRFVETKNLNAFSMWIDRAASRGPSDRCVELTNALACLE